MDERWSEFEARAVLEQWRRTGEPLAVFARERGISPPRLYWWRRKFGQEAAQSSQVQTRQPELLPVRVVPEEFKGTGTPIEVELRSGHVVRVGAGFDEASFRLVVALLEEAGC